MNRSPTRAAQRVSNDSPPGSQANAADANEGVTDTILEEALSIVQPFFPKEWAKTETKDVTLKIIT